MTVCFVYMLTTDTELKNFNVSQEELQTCMNVVERLQEHKTEIIDISSMSKIWKRLCHNIDNFAEDRNSLKKTSSQRRQTRRKRKHNEFIKSLLTESDTFEASIDKTVVTTISARRFWCYICKQTCSQNHSFYKAMCINCGLVNQSKRVQTCNLAGKYAIVTGGRIKIGFEVALKLLRAESTVIITTRFAVDAQERFERQTDYNVWKQRLHILRADFLIRRDVDNFCNYIQTTFCKIDILINNAAQTIFKPEGFYRELYQKEQKKLMFTDIELKTNETPLIHQWFPPGQHDNHGQQLDLRPQNSWVATIESASIDELLQTQIVNCSVPYLLIQSLMPLMRQEQTQFLKDQPFSFVVNVSAMEGVFDASYKSARHPHTNIAKAGLNMITRTCAKSYLRDYFIAMNSVDTGYITNEFPFNHANAKALPPLDEVDGAARILDPIFMAFNANFITNGAFLKDYHTFKW